jgi:AcrR family transcriptional regulator
MNRREKQAIETRRDILDAALRLFAERGYARTSIADIAGEAGVAVPTVYTSVGAKRLLLRQLLDRIDEQAGVGELAASLHKETDPAAVLSIAVHITRQIAERSGDIIRVLASAAAVETEMAETYAAGLAKHRAGARATVERLVRLNALRPERSPDGAAAIIATLTSTTVYETLTRDYGWTFDQCAQWVTDTLTAQLLAPGR